MRHVVEDLGLSIQRSTDRPYAVFSKTSGGQLIEDPLVRFFVLLLSLGCLFFFHGLCRLFLRALLTVLTFAHDGSPFSLKT